MLYFQASYGLVVAIESTDWWETGMVYQYLRLTSIAYGEVYIEMVLMNIHDRNSRSTFKSS
jgi:hypothetical protein